MGGLPSNATLHACSSLFDRTGGGCALRNRISRAFVRLLFSAVTLGMARCYTGSPFSTSMPGGPDLKEAISKTYVWRKKEGQGEVTSMQPKQADRTIPKVDNQITVQNCCVNRTNSSKRYDGGD